MTCRMLRPGIPCRVAMSREGPHERGRRFVRAICRQNRTTPVGWYPGSTRPEKWLIWRKTPIPNRAFGYPRSLAARADILRKRCLIPSVLVGLIEAGATGQRLRLSNSAGRRSVGLSLSYRSKESRNELEKGYSRTAARVIMPSFSDGRFGCGLFINSLSR